MRTRLILISILALPALMYLGAPLIADFFRESTPPSEKTTVTFPPDFFFELVDTPEARAQGLSGRTDVPHDYGMLFSFPEPGYYRFWMHEMLVPIDIIWIDADGSIVGIEEAVAPDTYPQTFAPPSEVSYVLETRAHESARLGLSVGDRLPLPIP